MRVLRRLFIIGLLVLIGYIASFIYFHPTHFIYADGPVRHYGHCQPQPVGSLEKPVCSLGAISEYIGGEPIMDCSIRYSKIPKDLSGMNEEASGGTIYVRDCLVTNVPVGRDNMYVKTSSPFIYWTIVYPYILPIIIIGLWVWLFGKQLYINLTQMIKKVNESFNKEQPPEMKQ